MGAKQSVPKITAQDKAILDLKLQRDKLKQYQRKLDSVAQREHEIAKQCLANGQKDKALLALRRRKYQESMLTQTHSQLEQLEQLASTIEFSLVQQSVLHGLKQGTSVLQELHKEMNIEAVEKLIADTEDAREYQREIDELLTSRMTLEEEEAVQDELAELQTLVEEEAEPKHLPSVPAGEVVEEEPIEEVPLKDRPERVALEA